MIDYIRYRIDGKSYELTKDEKGFWSKDLNAPSVVGRYDLVLEIGQNGIVTYIDSKDPRYSFYLDVIRQVDKRTNLISYLPGFLRDSEIFKEIFDPENIELDTLYYLVNRANLDAFIRTASNERIQRIEKFLGLKGLGTLEQRKLYLLTLFQRGKKLDEGVIKEVANTITGSDCIVTFFAADEASNPKAGYGLLRVEVLSPSNDINYRYPDIVRALKPLVPAHIDLLVVKFFATWEDVRDNFESWESLSANMTDWKSLKDYIPPLE